MVPRLLVVQHEPEAPAAWYAEWLVPSGVSLSIVLGPRDSMPESLAGFDGLLVLGGAMGAGDDAAYPWLVPTRALIRDAVERGTPCLGICLGHQLACVALGGEVERNPAGTTIGLVPVGWTEAAHSDPLFGPVVSPAGVMLAVHWNGDVVTRVPTGAEVLAWAPDGTVQALRLGERAWGVQFHPEVSPEVLDVWAQSPDEGERAATVEAVRACEEELRAWWRPMAKRYAELLHQHAEGSAG